MHHRRVFAYVYVCVCVYVDVRLPKKIGPIDQTHKYVRVA